MATASNPQVIASKNNPFEGMREAIPGMLVVTDDEARLLTQTTLFEGVSANEAVAMLGCLRATRRDYEACAFVMRAGDAADRMGLVLAGSVSVEQTDIWGARNILTTSQAGSTFAAVYACAGLARLPVDVVAVQPSSVLLFELDRVLSTCSNACEFHQRVVHNLLGAIAHNNLKLTMKIDDITPRTIRKRILSFLGQRARQAGSRSFSIEFNRQELADYLCVDRSALSHELAKMAAEGLIEVDRNRFTLLARTSA